jgi:hypothetical protein
MSKLGFAALNDNLNQVDVSGLAVKSSYLSNTFQTGRVLNVILDENSEGFVGYGEWNSIGTIEFELVNFQTPRDGGKTTASPLLSNNKKYPLVNELVLIFRSPDTGLGTRTGSTKFYYLNTLSLWNHPHHNAYPNPLKPQSDEQTQDYTQTSGGNVRRVKDGSTEIDLNGESGGTFVEETNIHPILPFAGDNIVEGRFGNSIRLGNTSKTDSEYTNNWSENGDAGSPITIIRNGQPEDSSEEGWLPITENINKDLSSIYLTKDQKIPLELDNETYEAFDESPISTPEYLENQIILNSGRLVLNSKTDSVLISANKQIAITSIGTVGISSDTSINLVSSEVNLGSKDADQSLILGDDFMQQFEALLKAIKNICSALEKDQTWPGGAAVPNIPTNAAASNAKAVTQSIINLVKNDKLISKVSRTV